MAISRTGKVVLIITGILAALAVVVVIGIVAIFAMFGESEPSIQNNSVLVLNVGGSLPDYVPEDPVARLLGREQFSFSDLITQVNKAKVDKRISAILFTVDTSGLGWAKADELRDAIAEFRKSGKPAYAYIEIGMNKEYYIATACEKIFVAPPGDLFIQGLAGEAMFFRGSLDKLGIYPDVFKIGKYKNAPDQFTNKEMSNDHRFVMNSLLDDISGRVKEAIAKARSKSAEEVQTIIDDAPYNAPDALKLGLIDGAMYRDDVEKELKKRLGYKESETLATVTGGRYRHVEPESLGLNTGENVALIYGTGTIDTGRSSGGGPYSSQSIGSDTMVKAINDARDDKTIKAIIIRVDSPGGSSLASDLIWRAVESARAKKPVVISMSDVAASGGYYISCNANKIVAEPSTITGSIGIFAGKPVLKGFYEWLGISNEYVLKGKNAGIFRETERFSDSERTKFEKLISDTYNNDFVPKVAAGRKRDAPYIHSIGEGHVWTGAQAKGNGLVDEFGGLDRAIEIAKQLAGIPADKGVHRVILPYPRTILENLTDVADEASVESKERQAILSALPEDVRRALQYGAMLDRMKRGEAMAMMPFELRIR